MNRRDLLSRGLQVQVLLGTLKASKMIRKSRPAWRLWARKSSDKSEKRRPAKGVSNDYRP
jgi:hypothetical protein